MADEKHILVVDDHFEMLELLRSMLELSGHEFEVLAVPSAEEAMFELPRRHFDLVITDVRLPGMNGFDFVRRIRRRLPDIPVIMITGYTSEQGQNEAAELGVYRYFKKPLDADAVLTAVNTALYGEAPPPEPEPATPMAVALPDMVHRRLDSLRADTGAASLVLATVGGQMLLELGQQRGRDVTRLIQMMAQNVRNSFGLGEHLGESVPFTFQYHTGQTLELYTANVGESYFVTLFFSVESRRGRIGTIWVFAQRAIKELAALLPPLDAAARAQASPAPAPPAPAKRTEPAPAPRAKPRRKTAVPDTAVPEEAAPEPTMPALTGPPEPPPADVTEADMEGLLAALHLDEASVTTDLDSFWDEALQESEGPAQRGNTLSFDQALALVEGLPELTPAADAGQAEVVQAAETAEAEVLEAVDVETAVDMDDLLTALNLAGEPADVDLDAFWDEAMQDDDTSKLRGLTFEEAQRRGLISTDLDLPEG